MDEGSESQVIERRSPNLEQQQGAMPNDPLALSNFDQPGSLLNGSNFLNWSRNVRMALGAKSKLVFLDGSVKKPFPGSPNLPRWVRADYMVRCWLLSSMESGISETFMYVESAAQLWEELVERFGQANGPLLYQLKRSLASLEQGNSTVGEYNSKLIKGTNNLSGAEYCFTSDEIQGRSGADLHGYKRQKMETFPQGKVKLVEVSTDEEKSASLGGTFVMDNDNVDPFQWLIEAPSPKYYELWSLLEQNYEN